MLDMNVVLMNFPFIIWFPYASYIMFLLISFWD